MGSILLILLTSELFKGQIVLFSRQVFRYHDNIDGIMQERCNSSALAMELSLPCTNPLIHVY